MAGKLKQKGDIFYNILDPVTGSPMSVKKQTTLPDGTIITDDHVDGVVVFKLGAALGGGYGVRGEYLERGAVNLKWFGLTNYNLKEVLEKTIVYYNRIFIPKDTYFSGQISIQSFTGKIFFNESKIVYDEQGTVNEDNASLFLIEDSTLEIDDVIIEGKMFSEFGGIPNTGVTPRSDYTLESPFHRGLNIFNSQVKIYNINISEFVVGVRSNSSNLYIDLFEISNGQSGIVINGNRGDIQYIKNGELRDMRYTFQSMSNNDNSVPGNVTGAYGSGINIDQDNTVSLQNVIAKRCGTDSFRVQGTSKLIMLNCKGEEGRRHHFANYGVGSYMELNNCVSEYVANYDFWNGDYLSSSFNRPHQKGIPRDIVVTSDDNVTNIKGLEIINHLYEDIPTSDDTTGVYNATNVSENIAVVSTSSNTSISGLNITSTPDKYSLRVASTFNCDNFNITTKKHSGPQGVDDSVILINSNNVNIKNGSITGGDYGIYIGVPGQNLNINLSNLEILNTFRAGIRCFADYAKISNIRLVDVNTSNDPGNGDLTFTSSAVLEGITINNNGSNKHTAVLIGATSPGILSDVNITGDYDKYYNVSLSADSSKTKILTRPVDVDYDDYLVGDRSLVHLGYVKNLIATTTEKGMVNQAQASSDAATAPGATYSQTEVQSILDELRDLKNKMRDAGILDS